MDKIYKNLENPGSLSSVDKLYKYGKEINPDLERKNVEEYLEGEESYTLHKPVRKRFPMRMFIFPYPGHTIISDVCYINYEGSECKYLLFFIDGYSKYLSVFPLKSLKAEDVVPVVDNFLSTNIYAYKKFFSDEGQEFLSKKIISIYKKHNIFWYTTKNKLIKASPVERSILTMKRKLSRYATLTNSECFLKDLDKLVLSYNLSIHRTLNRKPLDVHLMMDVDDIINLSKEIYNRKLKNIKSVAKVLPIGSHVRVSVNRDRFSRAFHLHFSREVFKIEAVSLSPPPTTYTLSDLDGQPIVGSFYHHELVKVKNKELYDVEIIRKKKVNGKVKFLVKYINFPASKPKWVVKKNLEKK